MAEERLIDDDKDRKYRIRINENGEEELVIVDTEEEEEDFSGYGVITDGDEQSAEQSESNLHIREQMLKKAEEHKEKAKAKLAEGDFESAQYELKEASELTEYDGELYYLQLKAYSRNMTDFLALEKCADAADGVREYSSAEQKQELASLSGALEERIKEFTDKREQLSAENERGKAERRETFANGKKRAFAVFACSAVPFVALFVLAIVFGSMIYADVEGLYMILTVAFSVAAAVAFFVALYTFTRFSSASRKVKLNEEDTSTKIGREFLSCSEELENLNKIYSAIQNDIS